MSLKYSLTANYFTGRNNDYMAHTHDVKSHNIESITEMMIAQGSTITTTDTLAVLNAFFETVKKITRDGETINTDIINTNFSIQGVFEGVEDGFDNKRHAVKLNLNAGKGLKKVVSDVSVEKTIATELSPHIVAITDSITGNTENRIASATTLEIRGSLLKIMGDSSQNGVHFVASDGRKEACPTLIDNKPSRLIVVVPSLSSGEYSLQITTQFNGSSHTHLVSPRTGVFKNIVTIV